MCYQTFVLLDVAVNRRFCPLLEQVVSSSTIYTISIIYLYLYYLLILIKSFVLVIQPLFLLDPYSAPWYRSPPHDRLLLSTFTYLHPSAAAELPPSRSESISAVVAAAEVAAHRVLLPPGAYCLPPHSQLFGQKWMVQINCYSIR
jgi:hypothetical protein